MLDIASSFQVEGLKTSWNKIRDRGTEDEIRTSGEWMSRVHE
jgi:hypothetical protein